MAPSEEELRKELGIPDKSIAKQVIILDQSCHMDWDWLQTFHGYYTTAANFDFPIYAVRTILGDAVSYLDQNKSQPQPYYYSLAEIGYLQQFARDQPAAFARLQHLGGLLRIVGGGITSPDDLIPHGEAILRNFLIANTWVRATFPAAPQGNLPPLRQVWIPDDFGHDSQFPILVEALGLEGVGFSRIPGDPQQYWTFPDRSGGPEVAAAQLAEGDTKGVDFIWRASDGSTTLAHWMQAGYFQGQDITGAAAVQNIQACYTTNSAASPTPYIYVPVANDFQLPKADLLQSASAWNEQNLASTGVYAVAASFDQYMRLVNCYRDQLETRAYHPDPGTKILSFQPTPYWTGFYASRPALKRLHQSVTRALLGAEVLSVIADRLITPDSARAAALAGGWAYLVPSTHHDYVTGTSANQVYLEEQIPLLTRALDLGDDVRAAVTQDIATLADVAPGVDQVAVVVFNQLGFARGGLVEMEPLSGFTPVSFGTRDRVLGPVQISAEGTWLFAIPDSDAADVPSLGYSTYYLRTGDVGLEAAPEDRSLACRQSPDEKAITLVNAYVSAQLTEDAGWGLASFEQATNQGWEPVLGGTANMLLFYQDGGDLYQFGNETGNTFQQENTTFQASSVVVLEAGPVRLRVAVAGSYTLDGSPSSVIGEPFLRMITTAAAPNPYSVFVRFPFRMTVDTMIHGTPYHWDAKPAQPIYNTYKGWVPPIFEATHHFVIAAAAGTPLGAIYHAHAPAWAVNEDNSLLGCVLRNPTASGHNTIPAAPGDPDSHRVEYALGVPAVVGAPESGAPLRVSLAYQTPLIAQIAGGGTVNTAPRLPDRYSLAVAAQPQAIVTAAKAGTVPGETAGKLVLRVYQPTNTTLPVTLTLTPALGEQLTARGISVLETPLDPEKQHALDIKIADDQITFTAHRALTTLAIG